MKTLSDFIEDEKPATEKVIEKPLIEKPFALPPVEDVQNGFVIQEVEMKGFMRYLDPAKIPFSGKFLAIIGKTGSGKTSILDAITFALYKRTSRTDVGLKIEEICQPGGYVKVCFRQSRDTFEVTRGLNGKTPYLTLKKNGEKIPGKISEIEGAIQDIIGMDYVGFNNSTFVRQDEMKAIGAESGPERLEIFQKLFRLETFEKAREVVDKKLGEISFEVKELSAFVQSDSQSCEEKNKKIPERKQEIENIELLVKRSSATLAELAKKNGEAQAELKALEKVHEEYLKNKNQLDDIRGQAATLKQKRASAISKHASYESLKKEIDSLREEIADLEPLAVEKEKLEELQKNCELLQSQLSIAKRQLESALHRHDLEQKRLEQRLKEQRERINKLKSDLNREAAFGILRAEGRLVERAERIPRELSWVKDKREIASQLERELEQAKRDLGQIAKKAEQINADSFVRSEIETQINRIQKDLQELGERWQVELQRQDTEIKEIEGKIKALGFGRTEEARLSELKKQVDKKTRQRKDLDRKIDEARKAGDMTQLIGELTAQISDCEAKQARLNQSRADLETGERRYEASKKAVETLREEHKKLENEVAAREGEKVALQKSLKDLKEEIKAIEARMKERERDLAAKQDLAEVYTILKESVFHKKGIVTFAINQLLPQLAIEASANLADLTDRRFTKLRLATYEESNRYGIKIEVEGSAVSFRDVKEFSGGEKTQINAALRFAIAKELASMPRIGRSYARMKTLFIDEGDLGSLDTEVSRELFVKKLFDMGEFFDRVILITHLSDIADRFPARTRVFMTDDGRSRVEKAA